MKDIKCGLDCFLGPNDSYHIARVNVTSPHDLPLHSHDYCELFWVERGTGIHIVNKQRVIIAGGDLVMIRPGDKHAFSSTVTGMTMVHIAFHAETLDYFYDRYFTNTNLYFWTRNYLPYNVKLTNGILSRMSIRADEALRYARNNIQLDSLLLFIFRIIESSELSVSTNNAPVWLTDAIAKYTNSQLFSGGIKSFTELCNRNPDHINRTVREHFGKTLTELINQLKLNYATTQLSMTRMPIKEICVNSGFSNMGYFYTIFKEFNNQTPAQYRKLNQMIT